MVISYKGYRLGFELDGSFLALRTAGGNCDVRFDRKKLGLSVNRSNVAGKARSKKPIPGLVHHPVLDVYMFNQQHARHG